MSAGQKPRWREHFPRMKRRGRNRGRSLYIVQYDTDGRALWPPKPCDPSLAQHYRRYPHPRSGREPSE